MEVYYEKKYDKKNFTVMESIKLLISNLYFI